MGFLDLFVERDKKPAPKQEKATERKEVFTPVPIQYPVAGGSVAEFTEHFRAILKEENERNFPGNDFYEFFLVKSNMQGLPEQQAYVIAFSGLSAAGLTKQKLVETAQKYLGIVEREMQEFSQSYEEMYKGDVTSVEQLIQSKTQEINDLTQKITSLNAEVGELRTKAMENNRRLTDKKNSFTLAGNAQKQEIENEIIKINQYIQ